MENTHWATLDWLSLIDPSNSLILGTNQDDVLSAQADGDIVSGLAGNDHLNSVFNRTALIGDSGDDTLNTNALVLQGDSPVHGLSIQSGGRGNDSLDATVTVQGGSLSSPPLSTDLRGDVLLDGGSGNDVINATATGALPTNAGLIVSTDVSGGSGNDIINVLADGDGPVFRSSIATNKVDAGSGNDHVTAHAETGFNAGLGIASNVIFGGTGNDILDASALGRSNFTDTATNELHGGRGNDTLHAFNLTNSNSSSPVGVNKLWGDEGNDTLEAVHSTDGENNVTDVTSYLDGVSYAVTAHGECYALATCAAQWTPTDRHTVASSV